MKTYKRFLAAVLVLVMLVSMFPAQAFAAETENQATVDTDDVSMEATNSFGSLLSEAVAEAETEMMDESANYEDGYNVTGLEIEGSQATVTYSSLEEAYLLVALYTEDGLQLITSAVDTVSPDETVATITFEDTMPTYFMASAYLMDTYDLSPLCASYDTPLYTQEMQELLASTVADYDEELVLNLDDSEETNFAIFAESTVRIDYVEGYNIVSSVDLENSIYVIENADERFTQLQEGQNVAYDSGGEDGMLIFKVGTITVDGTTVTIQGAEANIEEFFSAIKVETAQDTEAFSVDDSTAGEGVTYEGLEVSQEADTVNSDGVALAWEGSSGFSVGHVFNINLDGSQLGGEESDTVGASLSLDVKIKFGIDASFDFYVTTTRQYIKLKTDVDIELTLAATGKLTVRGKELPTICGPTAFGVMLKFKPRVTFELTCEASVTLGLSATFGTMYDSKNGTKDLTSPTSPKLELKLEGTIFFGVDMCPTVAAGAAGVELVALEMSAPVGFELSGTMKGYNYIAESSTAREKHACASCLELALKFKAEFSVTLKFLNCKWLTSTTTLGKREYVLCYAHYSFDLEEFGFARCTNTVYRVTLATRNTDGELVGDIPVKLTTGEELGTTNENGALAVYLPEGYYIFQAEIDDQLISVTQYVKSQSSIVLTSSAAYLQRLKERMKWMISAVEILSTTSYDEGSFPGNASWVLYTTGDMVIFGDGTVPSYSSASDTPWYEHRDKIKTLSVLSGVTGVGSYAFAGCTNLETVILEDTVTSLGNYAFSGCSGLKEIRLPADISLGRSSGNRTGVFAGCTNVTKIHYTDGRTGIIPGKYSSTSSLTSNPIYYADSLENIAASSLTTVYLDEGITILGAYAFYGCNQLVNVSLPNSLKNINANSFYQNTSLAELEIPLSVGSLGSAAFYGCSALKAIDLPVGLKYIPDSCFRGCTSLTEMVIPDTVTSLGNDAFYGCSGLTKVTIPVDITLGRGSGNRSNAFGNCINVTEIHYTYGQTGVMPNRSSETSTLSSSNLYYGDSLQAISKENLTKVVFNENITNIGACAFYGNSNLTDLTMPTAVTSIGGYAFYNCSSLTEIDIGNAVNSLGSAAFYGCTALESITLNTNLTSIPSNCFRDCKSLTELVIPDTVTSLGNDAFYGCSGLTKVTIPVDITLGRGSGNRSNAFGNCINVTEIHYTYGQTGVMPNRRSETSTLSSSDLYYGDSLQAISKENLTKVVFNENITNIGACAFYGNSNLTEVTMPTAVTSIGGGAFYNCSALKEIDIGNAVNSLGSAAFYGCTALESITLNTNLTSIPSNCFYNCKSLTELVIPDTVTSLGNYAFYGCSGLTKVTMPVDITLARTSGNQSGVFLGCPNVTEIHYTYGQSGVMPNKRSSTSTLSGSDLYYGSSLEGINHTTLTKVTFDADISSIGICAFYQNTALADVIFKGNAPSINSSSFYGVTANTYYPSGDETWTEDVMQGYGGTLTWISYTLDENGDMVMDVENAQVTATAAAVLAQIQQEIAEAELAAAAEVSEGETEESEATEIPEEVTLEETMPVETVLEETMAEEPIVEETAPYVPTEAPTEAPMEVPTEVPTEAPTEAPSEAVTEVTEPLEIPEETEASEEAPTVGAVYGGEYDTVVLENYNMKTAKFASLVPGEQYIMFAFADIEAEDLLASDNLLYIAQGEAAEDGTLSFEYVQRVETLDSYVVATGASNKDLSDAEITFPEMYADGELQTVNPTVIYNGETLVEGLDYTIVGDADFSVAGEYTCYIRGISNYTGFVTCPYTVGERIYVAEITLDQTDLMIAPGASVQLTATVSPENATVQDILWSSSDESVATVDDTGLVTAIADGTVTITATAADGSDASAECSILVTSVVPLIITTQPENFSGALSSYATFTVGVNKEDVTYQWYFSNDGETWQRSSSTGYDTDTLTVQIVSYRLGQLYRCEITDSDGNVVVSDAATMSLPESTIEIVTQPSDYYGAVADVANISVEATGEGLTYRWYYSGTGGETWAQSWSDGYNTNTLMPVLREYNSGRMYKCLITDVNGNTEWTDAVTMVLASGEITIVTQPVSYTGALNDLAEFTVVAEGVNLTYRWQFSSDGGTTWANSTNQGYNTATVKVRLYAYRSGYQYRCVIKSGVDNEATSNAVTLTRRASTVRITANPLSAGGPSGTVVTFTVGATGNGLTYQWQYSRDGENWYNSGMTGADTASLNVTVTSGRDGQMYRCVVTDDSGATATSTAATLRLGDTPVITSQPESYSGAAGTTATFTVEADGDGLSYQWQYSNDGGTTWNNSGATGATTASIEVAALAYRNGQMYRCIVTNEYGSVISDAVTLIVE